MFWYSLQFTREIQVQAKNIDQARKIAESELLEGEEVEVERI